MTKSTAQMLQEIDCGTAAEIVLDSRAINDPFGPTYLNGLDECLGRARPHSGGSRLERGDLVEVQGPSGSGKTTLLLFLLMTTLLPSHSTLHYPNPIQIDLGGRNAHAAFIYTTSHPNPLPVLERRIRENIRVAIITQVGHIAFTPELEGQIDKLVRQCLGRLSVIRCKPRWKEWSLAFKSLLEARQIESYGPRRDMEGEAGGMDLVICDGFGDGFWAERWNDENTKSRPKVKGLRGGEVTMGDVIDDIGRLRKDLGAVVILSVQGLWASNPGFYTTHLPPPYPNPFSPDGTNTTHSLNIQISLSGRVKPLQEPSDRTLIESLHIRDSTFERGSMKFEGGVRVVDGLDGTGAVGGAKFHWTVGGQGVHAWED